MNDTDLLNELNNRNALIIHCSRPGKGNEAFDALFFPDDLHNAIDICANQGKELCCSVIWPDHVQTFGDVGIVLKPRTTASVTLICTTDGGTSVDPVTGRRVGAGVLFSRQAVIDTFADPDGYNEWNVQDADTIGIFVKCDGNPPQVARVIDVTKHQDYDPAWGFEKTILAVDITLEEIAAAFPGIPIYTIIGGEIGQLGVGAAKPYA